MKYIIAIDPAGIGKTGIIVYNVLQKKIINKISFNSISEEEAINNTNLFFEKFEKQVCCYLKSVLVIIEDYQLRSGLKIKNPLSTPKLIGGLKVLRKYIFNLKYVLQSPVVKENYIYKGNIKITAWTWCLKAFTIFFSKRKWQKWQDLKVIYLLKINKKNNKKLGNKHINQLELTVRLHENPVQTKFKAPVAGGFAIDASSAKCQWESLNYSTLSV